MSDRISTEKWSLELLRELDWRVFEEMCAEFFRRNGFQAEVTAVGSDGGIDLLLSHPEREGHVTGVQCKRYADKKADVKLVREFFGAIKRDGHAGGIFITTSSFTEDAESEFAEHGDFRLVDGETLLERIEGLGQEASQGLLELGTRGADWYVPTCPNCDVKMVLRRRGSDDSPFWGCVNFGPDKCRAKFSMSAFAVSKVPPAEEGQQSAAAEIEPAAAAAAGPKKATPISASPMVSVIEAKETKSSILGRATGAFMRSRTRG